ncbi:MAG: hypothetical protein WCC30_16840, partial [Candidatus Dormiibacterota bacterium]
LTKAYSIIETTPEMEEVINKLGDVLNVDHVVYNLARPPAGRYIQLTYILFLGSNAISIWDMLTSTRSHARALSGLFRSIGTS